ncbi:MULTISPECIES: DUF1131 family protein [Moorena]|uniref:DUF1131 family protein n=1 Tax=Moorena producens (strain JHB) TaxID=1454205 RepID=A0A1D9G4U3_MOOP1|nr:MULTISPECIES: DUF1131 family protein [Moorena]NEQ13562.1 DUF1131 family protein [Moorena sp. SIO3E2]NES87526.1 DUF1131 family protein [Moorena sp. SIO2B7]AOY82430.1 DUF1131 family protein [Moorena producens JHB]NEP33100.1 DUF1131 family protein [Moorena sp. SIO3B2]NES46833.1 DUF1131 family protein [Moorena sp. SIO2C4]
MYRKTLFTVTTIVLLTSILGACAKKPSPPETKSNLRLTADGLGKLNKTSNFDADTIKSALPSYTVKKETTSAEGETYDIFRAYWQDSPVVEIDADISQQKIGRIEVLSDRIPGPKDVKVGIAYSATPGHEKLDCLPGVEESTGKVFCKFEENASILYVYQPLNWEGPYHKLPPLEVLTKAKLDSLRWIAP